jgi:hypothetical protein
MSNGERPSNWLIPAIFSTLCCCLPLGIVAIIQATKVNPLYDGGNVQAAIEASGKAKMWTLMAVGIGFVLSIIMIILQVVVGIASANA